MCLLLGAFALSRSASAKADEPAPTRAAWPADVIASVYFGDGLRFNNPYRLATVLGSDARSLSRTAGYADVGIALVLGDSATLAHGLSLRMSVALEGVEQSVLTPSYVAFHRIGPWGLLARAGFPIVLTPETAWGLEGALGAVWFARAGVGLAAELVGDLFYGAGTREVATPAYPVLSGQVGLWLAWEALL